MLNNVDIMLYAENATAGQWRAHGRYLARGSATREGDPKAVGFDGGGESVDLAERLEGWQRAEDDRLWKLIVSPEFGDRADLKRLTRDLVSRMERGLGTPLEWVAAAHYNTEHPHVHIALRGYQRRRTAASSQPGLHQTRYPPHAVMTALEQDQSRHSSFTERTQGSA
jgi:type IV secretory pathway VirD2 relaxase